METFVAVVLIMSGPRHQTRFFGEFPSYAMCSKFTRWQGRALAGQNLEFLTRCLSKPDLRNSYPSAFIEEPST